MTWPHLATFAPLLGGVYLPEGEELGCVFEPTVDRGCFSVRYLGPPGTPAELIVQLSRYESPRYAEGAAVAAERILRFEGETLALPEGEWLPPHARIVGLEDWLVMMYPQAQILVMVWHAPIPELTEEANVGLLIVVGTIQSLLLDRHAYQLPTITPTPTVTHPPPQA